MAKRKGMKPRVKKMWIDALRSGEYKQTKYVLRRNRGGFCCLGVLTDLYMKDKKIVNGWGDANRAGFGHSFKLSKDGEYKTGLSLPNEVMEWSGLDRDNPVTSKGCLGALNDDGTKFKKIADVIEDEL